MVFIEGDNIFDLMLHKAFMSMIVFKENARFYNRWRKGTMVLGHAGSDSIEFAQRKGKHTSKKKVERCFQKTLATEGGRHLRRFSDIFKISWVRTSVIFGAVVAAAGLVVLIFLRLLHPGYTQPFSDVKAFVTNYGLIGIFLATILAGTIVPLGSPALVTAAALFGVPKLPLILTATTGFTIGMLINYGFAYHLGKRYVEKRVPVDKLEDATSLWRRWGWIIYTAFGLIPVLPVEFLSLVCGLLKTRLDIFLVLTFVPRLIVFTLLSYFGEYAGIWIGL